MVKQIFMCKLSLETFLDNKREAINVMPFYWSQVTAGRKRHTLTQHWLLWRLTSKDPQRIRWRYWRRSPAEVGNIWIIKIAILVTVLVFLMLNTTVLWIYKLLPFYQTGLVASSLNHLKGSWSTLAAGFGLTVELQLQYKLWQINLIWSICKTLSFTDHWGKLHFLF